MSVREGYKMTELGEMPSEWEVDSLINTTRKIGDGLHGTPTYSENSDYYFINGNNLANGKIVFFENTKTVSAQEYKKHYISLDTNSLLISLNGTIGNIARYHDEKVILGKSAGYIIFPSDENTSFFYHYMQSKTAMSYFLDSVTGTTIRNLSLASLRNMRVPILPLPEQQKIADILSTVDEHISDTESLIEKMKVLKQGMMQHLLTKGIGHTEFKDTEIGRIPVEWEVRNCNQVFYTITDYVANGSFASIKENVKYLQNEDYAILVRLTDYNSKFSGPFVYVSKSSYDFLKKTSLFVDDIIIATEKLQNCLQN